jgi:hypothetical protein
MAMACLQGGKLDWEAIWNNDKVWIETVTWSTNIWLEIMENGNATLTLKIGYMYQR